MNGVSDQQQEDTAHETKGLPAEFAALNAILLRKGVQTVSSPTSE
jgi:hypothetical protein